MDITLPKKLFILISRDKSYSVATMSRPGTYLIRLYILTTFIENRIILLIYIPT